jgi:hypothetical protein
MRGNVDDAIAANGSLSHEPKEAAPLLLIIPTSSAALNAINCNQSCLVGSQAVGRDYQQVNLAHNG